LISERAAIRGDGFVQLTPVLERVAQIVVGLRVVGFEFERAAIRGDGFVELALALSALPRLLWASG
jgi:hypothetical protein